MNYQQKRKLVKRNASLEHWTILATIIALSYGWVTNLTLWITTGESWRLLAAIIAPIGGVVGLFN